jgi:uncharacterized protein YeaO (DUF488 family)
MMIQLKRVYEPASAEDGLRVLVERLWPRGLSKERAALDLWMKEIAPSPELRKWYGHELQKWEAFRQRYLDELQQNTEVVDRLRALVKKEKKVTFVYAAHDEAHNSALVLKEFLEGRGYE